MDNHSNFSQKGERENASGSALYILLKFVSFYLFITLFPTIAWSQVTPSQRWTGTTPGDGLGFFVNKLNDEGSDQSVKTPRQDGVPDVIISKTCDGFNCSADDGSVSVYSGVDSALIFQIKGTAWSHAVDTGDLNGDGISDLFVGESFPNGRARAFSGLDGSPIPALTFYGDNKEPHFGVSVASIGDMTGDGISDLAVGESETGGYVVLFSGSDGSRIGRIDNPEKNNLLAKFGHSISGAGDMNGDGTTDFIVGASGASPDGIINVGRAYLFSGRQDLGFPLLFHLDGENAGDRLGGCCGAVVSVRDLNGDGKSELAAAAPLSSPGGRANAGAIFIYDGATGSLLMRFEGENAGDYLGGEPNSEHSWVTPIGDINGDGHPDFMAGAVGADINDVQDAGRVLVFSGYDASILLRLDNPDASQPRHYFGVDGALIGNPNGGVSLTLVIGAGNPFSGSSEPGSAYLFSLTSEDVNTLIVAHGTNSSTAGDNTNESLEMGSAVINGYVYSVSDFGRLGIMQPTLKVYDPMSRTWKMKAPLPTARSGAAVVATGGLLYVVGGYDANGPVTTVESYDPASDRWTTRAPLPTVRSEFSVAGSRSVVYVAGGVNTKGLTTTVEAYDPVSDTWTTTVPMPEAKADLAANVINGVLYVHGKSGGTVNAYDAVNNTWKPMAPMPTLGTGQSVQVVNKNHLAIGEDTGGGFVKAAVYDPLADTWSSRSAQ